MHVLSLICIISLAAFVHGAAFNPLYNSKYTSVASQTPKDPQTTTPIRKVHEAPRDSLGTRLYMKRTDWLSSGTPNRLEHRQVPDHVVKSPTIIQPRNDSPTPAPTGDPSPDTTVHISDEKNFALVAPKNPQRVSCTSSIPNYTLINFIERVSDAEADGVSFCTPGTTSSDNCGRTLPDGFITAAVVERSDDGAWIQVSASISLVALT